ncbi:MAG TPA: protein kinase [Anaeromyxobacter sp.]|nr:protein kinase [Anaeromyxobacter sp.]
MECPECRKPVEEGSRFCPYCGAAAAPAAPADPLVGSVVNGKFRIEALIGQGGMGRVYRARHLTLDRPVVLKMLHRAYSSDPQIVQRFQREARAASRLNHQNSIAVLDFGAAEDGTLFMAMEYLAGRDLGRVVAEDFPLPEARIVRIGVQVLSALAEAHAQGIIHRDLKPENVMVEPRRDNPDFVKVLDFGIAKIVNAGEDEPKLTQAGLVCGTPEYMSPEQARGADLDARSDLYAMGVLLYQLCTGDLPFESDTPVGFLTAHLSQIPVPPRQRRPDLAISKAMDVLVTRALEKDPAKRFATADEMRAALLACAPQSGTRLGAEPSRAEATPAVTRRPSRRPFWAFVAVMIVALAGGGAIVVMVERTSAERRNFARDPRLAEPAPEPSALSAPPAPAPSREPAQAEPLPTGPAPATGEPSSGAGSAPAAAAQPPGGEVPGAAAGSPSTGVSPPEPAASGGSFSPGKVRDPGKAAALFRKAEARRSRQEVEAAIALYLAALEADPSLAEANKKLALCYQLKGEKRLAIERYRRYLATRPPDADRVRAILGTLE